MDFSIAKCSSEGEVTTLNIFSYFLFEIVKRHIYLYCILTKPHTSIPPNFLNFLEMENTEE